MSETKTEKKFDEKVLKVFKKVEDGKRGTEIRIVQWSADGKSYQPRLESREVYHSEDGEKRYGKAKGFTQDEFKNLVEKKDEVIAGFAVTDEEDPF
jgi:hypothetical protein